MVKSESSTFPGEFSSLAAIEDFVSPVAEAAGFDARGVYAVTMAVDEACTNIIEHAYGDAPGDIHLGCQVAPGECVIIIRDRGRPFDPESVPPPDLTGDLEDRRGGGLGLFFMRKLMDEVRFSFDPDSGNQVVMIKRADCGG